MSVSTSPKVALSLNGLRTYIYLKRGVVKAVDGVDLELYEGECLALVGESGSGKSITALSILRLLPPNARIVAGSMRLGDTELLNLDESGMRRVRGGRVAFVPQDPLAALNPVFTIADQVGNAFRVHRGIRGRLLREHVTRILSEVGLDDPERCARQYPHQLSGGMRQRVTIAIALASEPQVLIADEPTTALDVTIQRKVIGLMSALRTARGTPMIFITHDLALATEISDRVVVMYAGRVVETGRTRDVLRTPIHPYSRALVACIPHPQAGSSHSLPSIPGSPPDPLARPTGCPFHPRCPLRIDQCSLLYPPTRSFGAGREAACWVA